MSCRVTTKSMNTPPAESFARWRGDDVKVTAIAERFDRWWAVSVPDVKGGIHTQARRLEHVPSMVRDAVSMVTGVDPDDVEVTVHTRTNWDDELQAAITARRDAAEVNARASELARDAARKLIAGNLTTPWVPTRKPLSRCA